MVGYKAQRIVELVQKWRDASTCLEGVLCNDESSFKFRGHVRRIRETSFNIAGSDFRLTIPFSANFQAGETEQAVREKKRFFQKDLTCVLEITLLPLRIFLYQLNVGLTKPVGHFEILTEKASFTLRIFQDPDWSDYIARLEGRLNVGSSGRVRRDLSLIDQEEYRYPDKEVLIDFCKGRVSAFGGQIVTFVDRSI